MAFKPEELEPYFQQILDFNRNYYPTEPNLTYAKEFLTGQTTILPAFVQTSLNDKFSYLTPLLLQETVSDENKKLLIDFFNEPLIHKQVRYRVYDYIFPWRDERSVLDEFEKRKNLLHQLGWKEHEIGQALANRFRGYITKEQLDKNENAFIRLVNETYKNLSASDINALIQNSSSWDHTTALILYKHHRQKCFEYLGKFERSRYEYVDTGVMRFFLTHEKEKFSNHFFKLISSIPEETAKDISTKITLFITYNDFIQSVNELTRLSHVYLSKQLKKDESFYDGYANSEIYDVLADKRHFHLSNTGWSFYFILKEDQQKGIEYLNKFIEAEIALDNYTIPMLYAKHRSSTLNILTQQFYMKAAQTYHEKERVQLLVNIINEQKEIIDYSLLWNFDRYKSKNAKDAAIKFMIESDKEAEQKAIPLLTAKNGDIRIAAARILAQIETPTALQALKTSIETEKDDDARDIMLSVAGDEYLTSINEATLPTVVEKTKSRGKLKKAMAPWLEENALPSLFYKSGNELSKDEIRFMFYRMSRVKEMRSDIEVKNILHLIDREKSGPFAKKLIQLYFDNNAEAKFKYILALGALIGNDEVVDKLRAATESFIENARIKMAEFTVGALALQGSDKALRWVEFFSRKYRTKKSNVGAAAMVALETAADELGISTHELGDRIVPDFGFDGLFKHFVADGEEYRAFIDSNFKVAFFNSDNKKLKSLPAGASQELKDEFKAIAKEVRDIVKSQSSRLEYYLIVQRKWTYPQWQKFFLNNPVMFIYATRLLWGVYENDSLANTFLCNEDTSITNINGDEITIDETALIGIVHPAQLSVGSVEKWRRQFFDLSVESIFPQLERKIPSLDGVDMDKAIITKFSGRKMAQGSIRSTLERFGWHKGPTGDGGYINTFHLLHPEENIEATIEVDGVGAGFGWSNEEKLDRLYVLDKAKLKNSKWYNLPLNDTDDRLVRLKDLPPIFLHEMLAAVESIKEMEKV